ncbi:MAG: CerR family C-terminal domain-containing protein [Sedimentisphaerales bacterium]|nr:CerR family C-terminal domain-containing protein [Sedimentisphaerales bacterium]MBN2842755.1 CerR family C-terminal domain-containing protein [Sedimentisphaerales bacterium]
MQTITDNIVKRSSNKTYKTSQQTRTALIAAAGQLAGHNSFNNISTRQIADLAGENLGGIHYHFGCKLRLFKAVIDEALTDCMEETAADAIAPFVKDLDKPQAQSAAIRALVHRHISRLFNPEKPTWHAKVVYQLLQNKSELQDYLKEKLIEPDSEVQMQLIKAIRPELTETQAMMHKIVMLTPIFFHATNMEFILDMYGQKFYSEQYLTELEDTLVRQSQLLFGLPMDK